MKRRLRDLLDRLLRLILVLGLACSPLAQPLAMAALAAPAPQAENLCPHHEAQPPKPGDCCFKPGSACHCAMAVALPTAVLLTSPSTGPADHPVSAPRLTVSRLTAPEPPPPRP